MGRFFLFALVLVLGAAINPTLRAKALPYIQPALDPAYEWMARGKLKDIVKQMEAQAEIGRALPTPESIGGFLRERYSTDDAPHDPWGTPYFLQEARDHVVVGSAGRDREAGTEDDILSARVYRGRR